MQNLGIRDLTNSLDWVGAFDFDDRAEGISPRRLPGWTRPQVPQMLEMMLRMPSGVRLRFTTDATEIGVTALPANMRFPGADKRPVAFTLEVDNQLRNQTSLDGNTINIAADGSFEVQRGQPAQIMFEALPTGTKTCELWLPHNAYVEVRSLQLSDGATISRAPDDRVRWIHHGSSISHCMEADDPAKVWPAVAARAADVSLRNLGFGGQCHLDPFVARTIRDSDTDLVSLKTGINIVNMDSMRERIFSPLLHGFLDTIREGKPDVPIVMISPIFCPDAEDNPGPTIQNAEGKSRTALRPPELSMGSLSLKRIRELITQVVKARRTAGDGNLHYVDGLSLFGPADAGDLPDDLHPNPAGYVRIGERFATQCLTALADGVRA